MEFDLEYNSERNNLIIPEYGRHVQKLVEQCVALEDIEEQEKMAKYIISVMGNLQPHLRDVPDFKHKLWDQLFIISKFQLKINSPTGTITVEELAERPPRLEYHRVKSKHRYYGNNVPMLIEKISAMEDSEVKEGMVFHLANHMKKCYLIWNKDTVDDDVIFSHLKSMSKGQIDLKVEKLTDSSILMKSVNSKFSSKSSSSSSSGQSNTKKNISRTKSSYQKNKRR
ncbi:MAG: DUF4290 domain-containing protein [Flavobacteriaceae bacterium]|nr:DUF4290 domain-containing protein [Flavobacteriaceae bacterium]